MKKNLLYVLCVSLLTFTLAFSACAGENNASNGSSGTSGGTVISLGCRQNEISGSKKSSNTVAAGEYTLKDSTGNVLATFTVETALKGYMTYSSVSCTLYKGTSAYLTIK